MLDGIISFKDRWSMKTLVDHIRNKKCDLSWTGERIFSSAKQGDPDCVEAIISMLDSLARGISNVCYVLNPKVVVLGGGFTGQGQWLEEEIWKNIKNLFYNLKTYDIL